VCKQYSRGSFYRWQILCAPALKEAGGEKDE